MTTGVASRPISGVPVAVIDFETTGLTPGIDRVVEVSVVRVDPGDEPRLVLDTLVNPHRPVAATDIHGITDADVEHAPSFRDIAGELLHALEGCVVAAYNVYFDIRFLDFEMTSAGIHHQPPHLCLMYMRPLLGLGPRCPLAEACRLHGIDFEEVHVAAEDAAAAASLFTCYLEELRQRGIRTYDELARLGNYKFLRSVVNAPFLSPSRYGLSRCNRLRSRAGRERRHDDAVATESGIREYWDALRAVLADLKITEDERRHIAATRERLGLKNEQVRALHARAFTSVIAQCCNNGRLADSNVRKLWRLHRCLAALGWAPGDPPEVTFKDERTTRMTDKNEEIHQATWPGSFPEAKRIPWLKPGFEDPKKVVNWPRRDSNRQLLEWAASRSLWVWLVGTFRKTVTTIAKQRAGYQREAIRQSLHEAIVRASRLEVAGDGRVCVTLDTARFRQAAGGFGRELLEPVCDLSAAVQRARTEISGALQQAYNLSVQRAETLIDDVFDKAIRVASSGETVSLTVDRNRVMILLATALGIEDDTAEPEPIDLLSMTWSFDDIKMMPLHVMNALEERPGVYLITDRSDGKQYVGSAYGGGNIGGRWRAYGEGRWKENALLAARNPYHFEFRVLELLDPDTADSEVIQAETRWKRKLGTYAPHGLNAN